MGWLLKITEFWLVWGGITFTVSFVVAVAIGGTTGFNVLVTILLASLLSFMTVGTYVIWRVHSEQEFTVPEKLQLIDHEEGNDRFW